MKIQASPSTPLSKPSTPSGGLGNLVGLAPEPSNIDVFLGSDEYKNINEKTAAQMLGHFTQAMKAQGFPWRLYASSSEGLGGKITGTRPVGDIEALRRLQRGEAVLLQPMRNMQLDLSSDSLGAIAAAGTVGGGTEISSMSKLATLTKNTRVSAGSQGFEVRHGEPIEVRNLAELKLLYQMYRPEEELASRDRVGRAAQQFGFFNGQQGEFGYRYYQKDGSNPVGRVLRESYRAGARNAAMGVAAGALIGGPVALVLHSLPTFLAATAVGGVGFGLYGAAQAGRNAAKGRPLNTVEALDAVLKGQPVEIQETQMRSLGVPVLGKLSWISDRAASSTINTTQDLESLWWMQNRGAKEKEVAPAPKAPSQIYVPDGTTEFQGQKFRIRP